MSDRVPTQCDQCGQTDDHPKVHIGPVTKHHDCLSHAEEQMIGDSATASGVDPREIINACKGGLRGPKLLAHIAKLHGEG